MTKTQAPLHVVVDGSNIATEGRSVPSLAQLNEAVLAMVAQYPEVLITVVVDATFGHRIDKSERAEFDEAIANNELVAPPAGAIGRGDAFVLGIADKASASVLSNDSFQEFHGSYDWLFDEGRLIGGKPVPHVGWVFVDRVPVRGPVSRQATKARKTTKVTASGDDAETGTTTKAAAKRSRRGSGTAALKALPKVPATPPPGKARTAETRVPKGGDPVNELIPFLEFAERHPVGSVLTAVVDRYSSHGAYATVDDVLVYLPLRLMGPTPPNKARDVIAIGQQVTVEVHEFAPSRRSIDVSLVEVLDGGETATDAPSSGRRGATRAATKTSAAKKAAAKTSATKKAAAKKSAAKNTAAKKAGSAKVAANKAPAKKVAAKKTAAVKRPPSKTSPSKTSPSKTSPSKKSPAKKAAAKKVAAKKSPAKKAATNAARSSASQSR